MSQAFVHFFIPFFRRKAIKESLKKYQRITLTAIATKIYNDLILNVMRTEVVKILWKDDFWRNRSPTLQIPTIRRIIEEVRAKHLEPTILFVDFSKAFDFTHRGKMEQIIQDMASTKKQLPL